MPKMIHVRPVNGARVLDPDAVPVPEALTADGKVVVDKPFWRRRLKAKEVELVPVLEKPGPETDKPADQGEKNSPAKGSK